MDVPRRRQCHHKKIRVLVQRVSLAENISLEVLVLIELISWQVVHKSLHEGFILENDLGSDAHVGELSIGALRVSLDSAWHCYFALFLFNRIESVQALCDLLFVVVAD